jgi:hypothetical protein
MEVQGCDNLISPILILINPILIAAADIRWQFR